MARGKSASRQNQGGPLPPDGGPSIREFKPSGTPIKWMKRLDDPDREDNEAFVYQVMIASQEYALKVFKFSSPKSDPIYCDPELQEQLPIEKAIFYTDPFYAECRAYGRIEDGRVDRHTRSRRVRQHTAVKCYGYLLLDEKNKRWLLKQGHNLDIDVLDSDVHEALGGDTRVRAIVKHLDKRPAHLHAGNIRRAWESVRLLNNSLKIYNMDIKADNFIGYRLVDFGSSWTEPHVLLEWLDEEFKDTAEDKRGRDTENFQDMIIEEDIRTRLNVIPTSSYQLRSKGEAPWAGRELPKRRRNVTTRYEATQDSRDTDGDTS